MQGLCPMREMKKCSNKCVWYRKGYRYSENSTDKPIEFEECAINIAVDCLENLVDRQIKLQKEMNENRNAVSNLTNIFAIALSNRNRKEIE